MQRLEGLEIELEPILNGYGYEIVRAAITQEGQSNTLQIMVERKDLNEITIKDCVIITKKLSIIFEDKSPLNEPYQLEISSPGIERPLTRPHDYNKYSGQMVKILTTNPVSNKKKFKGILKGISENNEIEVLCNEEDIKLPLDKIDKATLVSKKTY
jgi:ribosome maturation factor RimP